MRKLTTALAVLAGVLVVAAPTAVARRQPTMEFRALYHMSLEYEISTQTGLWTTDPDPVRGLLDFRPVTPEIVLDKPDASRFHGKMGQDLYDRYQTFVFDAASSFTVGDVHATYEYAPGRAGMGTFRAVGRIVGGTGMFEGATGSFLETGPFVTWEDPKNNDIIRGKYNAAVTANLSFGH